MSHLPPRLPPDTSACAQTVLESPVSAGFFVEDGGLGVQDVLDNEVSEREDIPEGKYYIMSSVDNYAGYYDVWLQVTAEGNGSYSVMAYQQDEEYHLSEYDWMNITIAPEE